MASDWIPESVPAKAAEIIRRAQRIDVLTHQARCFRDFSILRLLGDVACQQKLPVAMLTVWVRAFTPESSEGAVAQEKLLVSLAFMEGPQEDILGSTDDYWAVIFA